jgi:hypothetical protein
MQKTMAVIASIAIAFLCVGIAGCAIQAPQAYRTSRLNADLPTGRPCEVNDHSCLSMMTEPAQTCLTAMGRCDAKGSLQPLDVSLDRMSMTIDIAPARGQTTP